MPNHEAISRTAEHLSARPLQRAKTNLELIDHAIEDVRDVCHRAGIDPLGRAHLNFAIAFLREAWIACDGQKASTPEQVVEAQAFMSRLTAFALEKSEEEAVTLPNLNGAAR